MNARVGVVIVTVVILLAVGAASVYAATRILGAIPAPAPQQAPPGAPEPVQTAGDKGLLIVGVAPGSPAMEAGLTRGMLILTVDGQEVNLPAELERILASRKPGDALRLGLRYGETQSEMSVTLGTAPQAPDQPGQSGRAWLGAFVAAPVVGGGSQTSEGGVNAPGVFPTGPVMFLNETGLDRGLAVVGITPGSPAAQAGLQPGDVIVAVADREILEPGALLDALQRARPGDTLTFRFIRAGERRTADITFGARADSPGRAYLGVYAWSALGR